MIVMPDHFHCIIENTGNRVDVKTQLGGETHMRDDTQLRDDLRVVPQFWRTQPHIGRTHRFAPVYRYPMV